jgi:hypothetical protein
MHTNDTCLDMGGLQAAAGLPLLLGLLIVWLSGWQLHLRDFPAREVRLQDIVLFLYTNGN